MVRFLPISPFMALFGSSELSLEDIGRSWELEEIIERYRIASWVNYWISPTLLHSNAFGYVQFQGCHISTPGRSRITLCFFPLDTGTTARGAAAGKEGLPKFQIGDGMNHYDAITCMLTIKAGCTYYSDSRGGELNVYRLSFWIGFLGGFKQMRTCANELTE